MMPTTDKRPLKVFLCHASTDKPKVRELYRYLKRRGINPWFDEEDLVGGQDWQVEIPKALATSDAIIICLTKNSVDKEGYIQKEIKFALDKALEMPEGRIFLIPVKFEECEVPFTLSRYQWVDLTVESGYAKMMKALKFRASQLERSTVEVSKKGIEEENLAREKDAREKAEKARLKAEEEERQRVAKEESEREVAEKAAREKAEKEFTEKARLKAKEEERQRITKEKAEREATAEKAKQGVDALFQENRVASLGSKIEKSETKKINSSPRRNWSIVVGSIIWIGIICVVLIGFTAIANYLKGNLFSTPTSAITISIEPSLTATPPSYPSTVGAATATVAAALTSAAIAQLTIVPTSTSIPSTGYADAIGVPGLVIMIIAFVVVILLARRLRSIPTN